MCRGTNESIALLDKQNAAQDKYRLPEQEKQAGLQPMLDALRKVHPFVNGGERIGHCRGRGSATPPMPNGGERPTGAEPRESWGPRRLILGQLVSG